MAEFMVLGCKPKGEQVDAGTMTDLEIQYERSTKPKIWRTAKRGRSSEGLIVHRKTHNGLKEDQTNNSVKKVPRKEKLPDIFDVLFPFSSNRRSTSSDVKENWPQVFSRSKARLEIKIRPAVQKVERESNGLEANSKGKELHIVTNAGTKHAKSYFSVPKAKSPSSSQNKRSDLSVVGNSPDTYNDEYGPPSPVFDVSEKFVRSCKRIKRKLFDGCQPELLVIDRFSAEESANKLPRINDTSSNVQEAKKSSKSDSTVAILSPSKFFQQNVPGNRVKSSRLPLGNQSINSSIDTMNENKITVFPRKSNMEGLISARDEGSTFEIDSSLPCSVLKFSRDSPKTKYVGSADFWESKKPRPDTNISCTLGKSYQNAPTKITISSLQLDIRSLNQARETNSDERKLLINQNYNYKGIGNTVEKLQSSPAELPLTDTKRNEVHISSNDKMITPNLKERIKCSISCSKICNSAKASRNIASGNIVPAISGAKSTSDITAGTQFIEEYNTELLQVEREENKTLKKTAFLEKIVMPVVSDAFPFTLRAHNLVTSNQLPSLNKRKIWKKGSAAANVVKIIERWKADRRITNYEREKMGTGALDSKEFHVLDVCKNRVCALEGGKQVLIIVDDGAFEKPQTIHPGCILRLYPPWEVLTTANEDLKTYLMFSMCEVLDIDQHKSKASYHLEEVPSEPFVDDLFLHILLDRRTNIPFN